MRAKIRELSKYGVITDVSPFNLPPEAFSLGLNCRFADKGVQRAPVLKRVPVTLAESNPRFLATNIPTTGFDSVIIGYLDGTVTSYNGTESDVSIFGYSPASSDTPYTSCRLGDVLYVNREDRVPWGLRTSDSIFQALTSTALYTSGNAEWNANWRCKILRACSGALLAFGISKSGTLYPTLVKTSEFVDEPGIMPQDWDATDPTNNCVEFPLTEMEGGITEAQSLGDEMYVYGLNETWRIVADGSNDVWVPTKIFNDAGCINTNCAVEVDKYHYVFGLNDIWRHDGTSKQSIVDGRVRKFIFNNMDVSEAVRCFVHYDRPRKHILFFYVSGDEHVHFSGAGGCNRVAVYDMVRDIWSFDDVPFVYGATLSNFDETLTYATVTTETYANIVGSYLDQEDSKKKTTVFATGANSTYSITESLYAIDNAGGGEQGALVQYAVDANATPPVTLVRDGLDLDELPDVEDLTGYKLISSIFPQARFEADAEPLYFELGAANQYNDDVEYATAQSYDADTYYQCDFGLDGRYLSIRMTHDDTHWFELTGYDLDLEGLSEA
jgi:hypothetical protein